MLFKGVRLHHYIIHIYLYRPADQHDLIVVVGVGRHEGRLLLSLGCILIYL